MKILLVWGLGKRGRNKGGKEREKREGGKKGERKERGKEEREEREGRREERGRERTREGKKEKEKRVFGVDRIFGRRNKENGDLERPGHQAFFP